MIWAALFLLALRADAEPLQEPPVAECIDGAVTLEVREARVTVGEQVAWTTRAYHWEGKPLLPGPTLVMQAGTTCAVTVRNALAGDSACNYHANAYHCPDRTNLHTHGLHVSPHEDDTSVAIVPGSEHTYTYTLGSDHLMGTFWYHAHSHGSTALQVGGGLAGSLLVLPAAKYDMPEDLAALYASATLLMVNHIALGESDVFLSHVELAAEYGDAQTIDPEVEVVGKVDDFYAVNGQYQPDLEIFPGEVKLLRIIAGVGEAMSEFELDSDACTMTLIARDGVFQATPYLVVEAVVLPPGGRADVAVLCGPKTAGSTVVVSVNPDPARTVLLGGVPRYEQDVLMTLSVAAKPSGSGIPAVSSKAAPLPAYLESVLDAKLDAPAGVLFFAGVAINGRLFPGFDAGVYLDSLCVDSVYQYELTAAGGGGTHPFHTHTNHFQIVSEGEAATDNGLVLRRGEWRDTVSNPTGAQIKFRVHQFTGPQVAHCHLLQHEDLGMMGLFDLVDCNPTPQLEVSRSCDEASRTVTVGVSGGTPGGSITAIIGAGSGTTSVPEGPCKGTEIPIRRIGGMAGRPWSLDDDGQFALKKRLNRSLFSAVCARTWVAVDNDTCEVAIAE